MINGIGKQTGFIKRGRKLTASNFSNTLMFPFCNQAKTSLQDIAADLGQQFGVHISKEAIHKKFTAQGVSFLQELVKVMLSRQFTLPEEDDLKTSFSSIKIKDSTKFMLPCTYGKDYPGFGNFSKKKGLMNLQYEYDLISGKWEYIELTNIKRNDQKDSRETAGSIFKGGLYIRDLGYVTPVYLKTIIKKEAYFLNRIHSQANIYTLEGKPVDFAGIDRRFKKTGVTSMDIDVTVYEKTPVACRLVIERVSDNEYQKRLKNAQKSAKARNVGLSNRHKTRCRYNTFITNAGRKALPMEKIRKTYYLRWQIELVFKTWKSFLEINKVKKVKKERMECQLLAKLLWILLNWSLFNTCNRHVQKETPGEGISVLKFFKRCIGFSYTLREVVLKRIDIAKWLYHVFLPMIDNTACEASKGKQTHYQVIRELLMPLS